MSIASAVTIAAVAALGGLIGCYMPPLVHRLSADSVSHSEQETSSNSDIRHPPGRRPQRKKAGGSFAMSITAAATSGLLAARFLHDPLLPVLLISGLLGVVAAFVDGRCRRLPNILILPAASLCAVGITIDGVVIGDPHRAARALASGACIGAVLLLLAIGTGGLGMGDVKVGAWTAMLAGWQGASALTVAVAGPFLLQAPIAVTLLAMKRVDRRTALPFGPALLGSGLVALTVV